MSRTAVIVDAVRSPMAKGKAPKDDKPGGALSSLHPVELLGQVLKALVERNDIDPGEVEDVIAGCVSQVGEQAGPVGRWAWLAAGLPEHVPGVSVHRACGSSQQSADFAAQGVIAGAYDMVVACGVESMSRIPMFTARIGQDPFGASVRCEIPAGPCSSGHLGRIDRGALEDDSRTTRRIRGRIARAGIRHQLLAGDRSSDTS